MNYKFEFTPQQVQTIGEVLASAPYKMVADIIATIQSQVTAQEQARSTGNGQQPAHVLD